MLENTNKPYVFISYSSKDEKIVEQFERYFKSINIAFFLDKKEIKWEEHVDNKISKGIEDCSHLIVIISPASLKSEWVPYEVGQARALKKEILPFLTHESMDIPDYLRSLHYTSEFTKVQMYFNKFAPLSSHTNEVIAKPEIYEDLKSFPYKKYINNSMELIDILDVVGDVVRENIKDLINASKVGVKTRILLLDPDSNFLTNRALQLGLVRRKFRENAYASFEYLKDIHTEFKKNIRIKTYDEMPMLSIHRFDKNLLIAPETLVRAANLTPHFLLNTKNHICDIFLYHFEAIWANSVLIH